MRREWLAMCPLVILIAAAGHANAQSCGELGGDRCEQSGSCPAGFGSLGSTYDCNRSWAYFCVKGVEEGIQEGEAPRDEANVDLPWQGGEELTPWKTLALSSGRRKMKWAGI